MHWQIILYNNPPRTQVLVGTFMRRNHVRVQLLRDAQPQVVLSCMVSISVINRVMDTMCIG